MPEVVENIPTLTDIVEVGDASMLNHFDAHQFDTSASTSNSILENSFEDDLQSIIEVSNIIENANPTENNDIDGYTDFEIPSIKFETEEQTEIPDQIFSNERELNNEITFNTISDTDEIEADNLKEKVDHAVKTILPIIEKQLKEQLYKELDI